MHKRQLQVLYRQFLFRIVDLEVLSADAHGDANRLIGQFAALLIFISVVLSLPAIFGGTKLAMGNDSLNLVMMMVTQHFLIATTMLAVGLFAVLSWDSIFPDRRDVMVLAPLPVRPRTMILAKVAAAGSALGLTIVLLHCVLGVAWPLAFAARAQPATLPSLQFLPTRSPVAAGELQPMIDSALRQALSSGSLSAGRGAALAIGVLKDGGRRVFTYGEARPDSLFEIGSISKTFTGLMLARMVAEGKARFDEPVRELLPSGTVGKPKGREITLLDLATHHSGLPRMPRNFRPADKENPYADYGPKQLYAYLASRGLEKPLEATFRYSNLGLGLLGQALAERAGRSYPEQLRDTVTGPLGMHDTVVKLSPEQERRFLQGHNAQHVPVHAWDIDGLAGAGAIRSTVGDMLTYLEANLHPERYAALAGALTSSQRLRASSAGGGQIALAWSFDAANGVYEHGGATAGFTSHAFFHPRGKFAAVVLSNSGPDLLLSPGQIAEHIRQRLSGQPAVSLDTVHVPAATGIGGVVRSFGAYWFTMVAAGVFIFGCVLGLQGGGAAFAAACFPAGVWLSANGGVRPDRVRVFSPTGLCRAGRSVRRVTVAGDAVAAIVLVSGAVSTVERVAASGAGTACRAGLGWIGGGGVGIGGGVCVVLSAHVAPDRRGARYPAGLAARRLVAAVRRYQADGDWAVRGPHADAEPATSDDPGVLPGNRAGDYEPGAEGPLGTASVRGRHRELSGLAGGEYGSLDRECSDDDSRRDRNPRRLRTSIGSSSQLDIPRHQRRERHGG